MSESKVLITPQILTDIADAIRTKYGYVDTPIKPIEMADYILDMDTKERMYRYYSIWKGLITPINGAYVQGFYNNGVVIGDNIYFPRDQKRSHWNGDQLTDETTFYCYNTKTNTLTSKIPYYNGNRFHINGMWYDGTAIYGFGYPYRYKTTDLGDTWTRDEMTSPGTYQPTPIFRLSNGRLIGTVLNRESFLMVSDDNGLVWTRIYPFTSEQFDGAWYTMSHGTICELDDCIALYFNTPVARYGAGVQNNDSPRYVSVSYDNGDTWSTPKKCIGDLGCAGYSISPGGFGYLGNRYHFIVGRRYLNKDYESNTSYRLVGDLCWYTGDANDVKNGTMELRKVLTETIVPKSSDNPAMSSEDTGNGGVCICNGSLYANYGTLIYNADDPNRRYASNQGIEMFKISLEPEADTAPYWDADFKDKFDQLLEEESTDYDYYFYSPNKTNLNYNWFGYAASGYIPDVGKFALPLGSGDFEINVIYKYGIIRPTDNSPKILSGIEIASTDSLHAYGGVNYDASIALFDAAVDVRAGTLPGSSPTYITFKRVNGELSITVNGVTIVDPIFGWTKNKDSVWQEIVSDSYVYNINATDAEVANYIASAPSAFNMSGLMMLTISC